MYISPDTNIHILKNCPLDNTYDHTIWFDDEAAQFTYFLSLKKYTVNYQTYQRVGSGKIRVQLNAEDLYDCNYLMFQNTSFGDKWFFAFIRSVEYINNITSEIEYEIDVMQTWHFNYELGQCFVDREHSTTDITGNNTVPEGLETGPYITTAESHFKVTDLGLYIMVTEVLPNSEGVGWHDPAIVGGFPVPCYWLSLSRLSDVSLQVLKIIIDSYAEAGKADAIVAIFTCPYNMVSTQSDIREQTFQGAPRTLSYSPKNKKLYTYPYCCMTASALGQGEELRYELFSGTPTFKIRGGFGANMQVTCTPQNYAGQSENVEMILSLKDFPICGWVSDYFQNWVAQNKANIAVSTFSSVAGTLTGALASGQPVTAGAAVNTLSSVVSSLAAIYQHSIIPDSMVGSANAADIMAVSKMSGFYTMCKSIRPEYARIIDDYFTMYGYKTNRVKIPNRNSRPHWTYTKTIGCVAHGSVPCDDMAKIISIYNNGITFWKKGDEIGNYSLDNRPA